MKKINITIIILGVISVTELITTKSMEFSIVLWIVYGIYKSFED